jgi:WD40 repeat protein
MLSLAHKLKAHDGICWYSSWSPDSQFLATCGQDRKICLWRYCGRKLSPVQVESRPDDVHSRTIRKITWRGDSRLLAAVSFDSTVSLWYLDSNGDQIRYLTKLSGQESEVKGVTFSPCGDMIATCSRDKSIWIFDISNIRIPGVGVGDFQAVPSAPELLIHQETEGEFVFPVSPSRANEIDCLAVLQGHSQDVKSVRFSPNNSSLLVSVSYDDSVRVWTSSDETGASDDWHVSSTLKAAQGGHSNTVWDIQFNPVENTSEFITVSADGCMKIWSRKTPLKIGSSWFLSGGPLSIQARPRQPLSPTDSSWVCTCSTQVTMSLDASVPTPPIYSVDWSKDGKFIALACGDNTIRIFLRTLSSVVPICSAKTDYEPNSVAFRPALCDGILVLSVVCDDGSILVYEFDPTKIDLA